MILITAQRLARKLCTLQEAGGHPGGGAACAPASRTRTSTARWQPYGPVGCELCKNTGYKGRVGIYQVMPISEEMERIIMKNGTAIDLADQAQREGVKDLRQSGLHQGEEGTHLARRGRGRHQRVGRTDMAAVAKKARKDVKLYNYSWERQGQDRQDREGRDARRRRARRARARCAARASRSRA